MNTELEPRPAAPPAADADPPDTDKFSSSAALLSVLNVSKPVKTGRPKGISLIRSSLPNMPLRDIVTPQRPLPPSLNVGPQKQRKFRNAKPPQPSQSGASQQQSVTDAKDSKDTARTSVTSMKSQSKQSVIRSSETVIASGDAPVDSTASSLPEATTPNAGTSLQLHGISSTDEEPAFHTAGSTLAPDSPGLSAASEKAKLWELVEQLERQLRQLRQDRAQQDEAMWRLRAEKADRRNQAMTVRQLQQQLLEAQSIATHLRSAADVQNAQWASKVAELQALLKQEIEAHKAMQHGHRQIGGDLETSQASPKAQDAFEQQRLELEACRQELAEQAAEMEAAAEYASSLAQKGHTIAAQSPGPPSAVQETSTGLCQELQGAEADAQSAAATIQALQSSLASSEAREKALHEELEPSQQRFEALGEELCTSQARLRHQSEELDALNARIQQLEIELAGARVIAANAEEDNQQLQQEVRSLQQSRESLSGRLNSCLTAISMLEGSTAAVHDDLQSSEATIDSLTQQLEDRALAADMAQEMQQLQRADLTAAEQVISRLTAMLHEHATAKDMQQVRCQDVEQELAACRESLQNTQAQLECSSSGASKALQAHQQLAADLEAANKRIDGLIAQLHDSQEAADGAADMQAAELHNQQLLEELKCSEVGARLAMMSCEHLTEDLHAAKLQNQALSEELESSSIRASAATASCQHLTKDLNAAELCKQELAAELASHKIGSDMATEACCHLQKSLDAAELRVSQLFKEVNSHSNGADMAADACRYMRADLAAAELRNQQLTDEVSSHRIGADMSFEACLVMQNDLQRAEQRLETMADQLSRHETAASIAADVRQDLQMNLSGLTQKVQKLETQLKCQETGADMAAEAFRQAQSEACMATSRSKSLQHEFAASQASLASLEADLAAEKLSSRDMAAQLRMELSCAKEAHANDEQELAAAHAHAEKLSQQLAEQSTACDEVSSKDAQLRAELKAAKQAEAAAQQALADCSNAATQLQVKLSEGNTEVEGLKQELQIVHQNWMTLVAKLHEDQGAETRTAESKAAELQQALDLAKQQLELKSDELVAETHAAESKAQSLQKALELAQEQLEQKSIELKSAQEGASASQHELDITKAAHRASKHALDQQLAAMTLSKQQLISAEATNKGLTDSLKTALNAYGEQQGRLQTAHDKVQALTDQLAAAEATRKIAETSLACLQAEVEKLEDASKLAQADVAQQLEAALTELKSQQAAYKTAEQGSASLQQDLLRMQTAMSHLQRDIDGYQRDNAALRASLGACQRQSEKFRTELLLAHRSQQSMLTTLEAARHEGNGLRSQLAAQLQGLPALRAMRGQLKAQQHALLGLQEQLQGTAYPALEAAAATSAISANQLPALHQSEFASHSTLCGPQEITGHLILSSDSTSMHHDKHPRDGIMPGPHPSNATGAREVAGAASQQPGGGSAQDLARQQTGHTRQMAANAGPSARQPDILRRSHEGLATLVNEIGQHVAETDPEQEARKRPRRTTSADGAKENRHRILQKLLAYPEVQRPDSLPPRQASRPALNALPSNNHPFASDQHGPAPEALLSNAFPSTRPQYGLRPSGFGESAVHPASQQSDTLGLHHIDFGRETQPSHHLAQQASVLPDLHLVPQNEPPMHGGSATSSQGSSGASSRSNKHSLPQLVEKKPGKASSRSHQPVIPLQTQHQAALQKVQNIRLLLKEQERRSL
ncbi:hypothetical protein WJX74_002785 [Apatococcus lobatus]|uniref:Uncharacterized protein n=1 Tax=Apatococcus lobatus TaxID=904363 RepID=A0AAW1S1X8_9CHLO